MQIQFSNSLIIDRSALTALPKVLLLIWYITGVAFHAIQLGDYLDPGMHFVSLVVALDLLGVALCDNHNNVPISVHCRIGKEVRTAGDGANPQHSGVAPANQTKARAKTKSP